jgi:hypothetical protein
MNNKKAACARSRLRYAVKTGKITKPKSCQMCGVKTYRINSHHEDYDKPFDVIWVCSLCHYKVHKEKDSTYLKRRKNANTVSSVQE